LIEGEGGDASPGGDDDAVAPRADAGAAKDQGALPVEAVWVGDGAAAVVIDQLVGKIGIGGADDEVGDGEAVVIEAPVHEDDLFAGDVGGGLGLGGLVEVEFLGGVGAGNPELRAEVGKETDVEVDVSMDGDVGGVLEVEGFVEAAGGRVFAVVGAGDVEELGGGASSFFRFRRERGGGGLGLRGHKGRLSGGVEGVVIAIQRGGGDSTDGEREGEEDEVRSLHGRAARQLGRRSWYQTDSWDVSCGEWGKWRGPRAMELVAFSLQRQSSPTILQRWRRR
jgi:hypothetical protein